MVLNLGRYMMVVPVLTLVLSGCTAAQPNPAQYVGGTLSAAMKHLQSPNVIDLSTDVAGQAPTYNENQDDTAWVVVVGCYKDNPQQTSDLGVIPSTAATSAIISDAKNGKYNQYVPACAQ